MDYWTIPRIWEGATSVILGGGPSLAQVDFNLVSKCRVIATNDAYKIAQWDCCYFKDKNWYDQAAFREHPEGETNGAHLKRFGGLKITSEGTLLGELGIKVLQRGRRDHLERDPNFITHCDNAGAEALALDIMFGSTTILLAGFDMKVVNGRHNWHENHLREMPDTIYQEYFMRAFRSLAKDAKSLGVDIFNCTKGSALDIFPIVDMEEIINADGSLRT